MAGKGLSGLEIKRMARGYRLQLTATDGQRITAWIGCCLDFYDDATNNMSGFSFEDRNAYQRPRERQGLVFFDDVASDHIGQLRSLDDQIYGWECVSCRDGFRITLRITWSDDLNHWVLEPWIENLAATRQTLRVLRVTFTDMHVGDHVAAQWIAPPCYKGKMATHGLIDQITEMDLRLLLHPLGLVQPMLMVGDIEQGGCAMQLGAWMDTYSSFVINRDADVSVHSYVQRHLEPRHVHYAGKILIKASNAGWQQALTQFTQQIPEQFGFVAPEVPDWAWQLRIASFPPRLFAIGDARWEPYLRWIAQMGFNATMGWGWIWRRHADRLCAIAPESDHLPLNTEHGDTLECVKRHLAMHHALGLRCILWTPTTGSSPHAPGAMANPHWFCRDFQGKPIGSWCDVDGKPWLIDSNPLQADYHQFWLKVIVQVAQMGFDGAFLDGVIARPPDAYFGTFPGQVQDGMIHALRRLRQELDVMGYKDFFIKAEGGDVSLVPGVHLLNQPYLDVRQPVAPTRQLPDELANTPYAFLKPQYPRQSIDHFTRQFELMVRTWPKGMPGNVTFSKRITQEPVTPQALAHFVLLALAGQVWSIPMMIAALDPNIQLPPADPQAALALDHENQGQLPRNDVQRQVWLDLIRAMSDLRETYPWLAMASVDVDGVTGDHGAVPVFVRQAGQERRMLAMVNMADQPVSVRLNCGNAGFKRVFAAARSLVIDGFCREIQLVFDQPIRLEAGQWAVWIVDA